MKLKRFIGFVAAALATTMSLSSFAYAENGVDSLTFGKLISAADFSAKDSYKVGDSVLLPLDFSSNNGKISAWESWINFNNEYLEFGMPYDYTDTSKVDAVLSKYDAKDVDVIFNTDYTRMELINGFGEKVFSPIDRTYKFSPYGGKVPEYRYSDADGKFKIGIATGVGYSDTGVEAYVCFTVKKDIDVDNLNFASVLNVISSGYTPGDTEVQTVPTGDQLVTEKLNACYGAFNVVVTPADLTSYIQELFVSVDGKAPVKITEYKEDGDSLVFPVRVTTNTTGTTASVGVKVTATTTSDLDGTKDQKTDVEMGTATITLNSPTSYEAGVTVK